MRRLLVVFAILPFAVACTHTVVGTKDDSDSKSPSSKPSGDTSDPTREDPTATDDGNSDATPSSSGLVGEYCGESVASAASCQNTAGYLRITSADTVVLGKLCSSYGAGCMPLENGYFDGTALSFDTTAGSGSIAWYFTRTTDGDLIGEATPDGNPTEQVGMYRIR